MDLVQEGVDLAIRWARAMKDSSLIARRFFEARTNLWASPKYMQGFGRPTHPRDLANAAFVTHPLVKGSVLLTNGKSDFEIQNEGQQALGVCYFVYAGRQYALPKVDSFIQTALGLFGGTGEQGRRRSA